MKLKIIGGAENFMRSLIVMAEDQLSAFSEAHAQEGMTEIGKRFPM